MKIVLLLTFCFNINLAKNYGTIPEDFTVNNLPLYDKEVLPYDMYSGFISIDPKEQQSKNSGALFFWMFVHPDADENTPLILWLNGGPGSSSLYGQFRQNGPLLMTQKPIDFTNPPTFQFRDNSWLQVGHLLYVDNPIGTGMSYNNTVPLRNNIKDIAVDFYHFLDNFFEVFTQYSKLPFYLSGQSFCGKYIPEIAKKILDQNQSSQNKINLKSVILSNPLIHPEVQRPAMMNIQQTFGLISGKSIDQAELIGDKCAQQIHQSPKQAYLTCNNITDYLAAVNGGVSSFDIRTYSVSVQFAWEYYLNGNYTKDVISALHLQNSPKIPLYQHSSPLVKQALSQVQYDSSLSTFQQLIPKIPFLIYIGQFDGRDGVYGHQKLIEIMDFPHKEQFQSNSRQIYSFKNQPLDSSPGIVGGYYKQVQNFSWLIASKAGHFVPKNQVNMTISLLNDYISNDHQIPCVSTSSTFCNQTFQSQCNMMNNCNDNGICSNGICNCQGDFIGAACEIKLEPIDTSASMIMALESHDYIYFSTIKNARSDLILTLKSQNQNQNFSVFGFHNRSLHFRQWDAYSFQYKYINQYYHVGGNLRKNVTQASDVIVVFNPNQSKMFISLQHKTVTFGKQKITESSFFQPMNGGFVLGICILIVGLASSAINCWQKNRIKRLQKFSYKVEVL